MSRINADSNGADFSDAVTSSAGGDKDHAPGKFTEEETLIHTIHREACEVRMHKLKSSSVTLFDHIITMIRRDAPGPGLK